MTIERELTIQEDFKTISDNLHRAGTAGLIEREGKMFLISQNEITDQEILDAIKAGDDQKLIRDSYNKMITDIYDEMESVFGTRNDVTASANVSTYEAMIKRPGNFIDETLGFTTEQEVLNFANEKMSLIDSFGVFRLKRIRQFESEKEAILAE